MLQWMCSPRNSIFVVVLVTGVAVSPAWGSELLAEKAAPCRQIKDDFYEEGWIVPRQAASPYKGQCSTSHESDRLVSPR